jgi:hypothetical protein
MRIKKAEENARSARRDKRKRTDTSMVAGDTNALSARINFNYRKKKAL